MAYIGAGITRFNTADDLTVTDDAEIKGDLVIDGTLNTSGAVVFNEAGADVDFRVESDTSQNALFVQGSSGRIGLNESSPDLPLHMTFSGAGTGYFKLENTSDTVSSYLGAVSDNLYFTSGGYYNGSAWAADDATYCIGAIQLNSDTSTNGSSFKVRTTTTPNSSPTDRFEITGSGSVIFNETGADANFRVESDNNSQILNVDAGQDCVKIGTGNDPNAGDISGVRFHVKGSALFNCLDGAAPFYIQRADFAGTQYLSIVVDDNDVVFTSKQDEDERNGGFRFQSVDDDGDIQVPLRIEAGDPNVIINTDGHSDIDFRVEGVGNTHMLFVDAGNDILGVGTSAPLGNNRVTVSNTGLWSLASGGSSGGILCKGVNSGNGALIGGIAFSASGSRSGIAGYQSSSDPDVMGISFITHPSGTGSAASTENFRIDAGGSLFGTDTSISSLSDQRLKTNIEDYSFGLEKFKQLQPRQFDWIVSEAHSEDSKIGFVSQEVQAVEPSYVYQTNLLANDYKEQEQELLGDDKPLFSRLDRKDAMYVSVIQNLIAKIEALEARVAELEAN